MKKLLYLLAFVIGSTLFNSCSKSSAQDLDPSGKVGSTDKSMSITSRNYVIVYATSTTALASAVNSKLTSSTLYKLAGGPYLFHIGGTEYQGQALYK